MTGNAERGPVLIAIARAAIERGADAAATADESLSWLREWRASFVTLRIAGELRGCIGSVEARRPLLEDVAHNARAAAYSDPRFPPVSGDDLARLQIEVSLLSAREPMTVDNEDQALAMLRPGVDGVYLEYQDHASTFLPQVWDSLPQPLEFLGELRRKAGLPASFWHPDVRLSRYTVEKFG